LALPKLKLEKENLLQVIEMKMKHVQVVIEVGNVLWFEEGKES
jgi:hypothetical protein